jgi:hypothetical protein
VIEEVVDTATNTEKRVRKTVTRFKATSNQAIEAELQLEYSRIVSAFQAYIV